MSEQQRQKQVDELSDKIVKEALPEKSSKEAFVKSFFGGNQYLLFVVEQYTDLRLVGTPPSSIGKFGGDTDNWMWPRHTGDFSVFRVMPIRMVNRHRIPKTIYLMRRRPI